VRFLAASVATARGVPACGASGGILIGTSREAPTEAGWQNRHRAPNVNMQIDVAIIGSPTV